MQSMSKRAEPENRQGDRFKQAARDLECDDSEAAFDAALKKIGAKKPTRTKQKS